MSGSSAAVATDNAAANTGAATQEAAGVAATTGANAQLPGGAPAYGDLATSSTTSNVFAGISVPAGSVPASMSSQFAALEDHTFDESLGATNAETVGAGKGSKRPDITRLSGLVKLAAFISSGAPIDASLFESGLGHDVAQQAGLQTQLNKLVAERSSGAATSKAAQATIKALNQTLWSDITDHLQKLGVSVPQADLAAPNAHNMGNKLASLGDLRIEAPTLDMLQRQGFDVTNVRDVKSMVEGHDSMQFGAGAPGTTTVIPGTAAHETQVSGAQVWDSFVTNWKNNPKIGGQPFQQFMLNALVGVGAIDLTGGNPTIQDVANAYQSVMSKAAADGVSVAEEFQILGAPSGTAVPGTAVQGQAATGMTPVGAENLANVNIDQAYVMHMADEILGPNAITPFQASTLANAVSKAGTTTAGADLINEGIVSLYDANRPTQQGSSFAASAYTAAQDALTQWGIPSTSQAIGTIVKQVLQTGVSTPYQIATLAQNAAEEYAKTQAATLYGPQVGAQAQAGVSVASQAQPYLQTAQQLLGAPAQEMSLIDPTGKWMKWSQGGTGPGGAMTQQEWASYLMSDPSYGYDTSAVGRAQAAQGAGGLLQLLGKTPQTGSNPFAGTGVASMIGQ